MPHLHLHLEPERRKRAATGLGVLKADSPADFFKLHRLDNADRYLVAGPDVRDFIRTTRIEQRAQGVDYVELRISPRRYLLDGISFTCLQDILDDAAHAVDLPVIRFILLVNRDSPPEFIDEMTEIVSSGLSSTWVAVDLAGDEITHPEVDRFRPLFNAARTAGMGVTVHAGEFAPHSRGVWRAIDDLGATRIGHGLSAAGDRSLLARLAADRVLLEMSISSNIATGAVPDLARHPARVIFEHGVPMCFNTDVPVFTGVDLEGEMEMAGRVLGLGREELTALQSQACDWTFQDGSG